MSPETSVVILNWNDAERTFECVQSLRDKVRSTRLHILVIDNGSKDDSVSQLSAMLPAKSLIVAERNLGFAGGSNLGIQRALDTGARYVLLLNNDVVVSEDFLSPMIAFMDARRDVGVCGPIVVGPEGGKVQSAGVRVTPWLMDSRLMRRGFPAAELAGSRPYEVDSVSGCAFLIRASTLEELGGLDARFFLYEEEVDFCIRVRRAGYRVAVVPTLGVRHEESATTGRVWGLKEFHRVRSRLELLRKHHSTRLAPLLGAIFVARQLLVRGVQAVLGQRNMHDLRGVLDGIWLTLFNDRRSGSGGSPHVRITVPTGYLDGDAASSDSGFGETAQGQMTPTESGEGNDA